MSETKKEQELRAALQALLDSVDYTAGACRPNEPVGGILPAPVIANARKVLLP